jgi:membrane fusion protein (multidrug efflux system)
MKNIVFLILGTLLLTSACKSEKNEQGKGKGRMNSVRGEGYVLQPQIFHQTYTASGSLLPNEEVEIHPEITGRVTNIHFTEGSKVRKGQTLITLFDADILAAIQKLKKQKALQEKLLERQQALLKIGGISQQDFETTQTNIATIDADIAVQEAELRRTKIIAPFDGVIGIRNISVGAIVSPTTTIALLQQIDPLKMDFTLPEQYRKYIAAGKEISFKVKGILNEKTGTIKTIDAAANAATRTIRIRAIVPNNNSELLAGSFAEVKVPFESSNDALLIPTQAVIPTTRDKKVAVVNNGKAALVTVKLGVRTEDKVEVLEGLKSGDTILTTGLMQVKPGMDITITKIKG